MQTANLRKKQVEVANAEIETLIAAKEAHRERKAHFSGLSKEFMSDREEAVVELNIASLVLDTAGLVLHLAAAPAQVIPDFEVGVAGFGGSPMVTLKTGGTQASSILSTLAQGLTRGAGIVDRGAQMTSAQAGYWRRKEDWDFQAAQADTELRYIDRQIDVAKLRSALASLELTVNDLAVTHNAELDRETQARFSNQQLYQWHAERLTTLYEKMYSLATEACQRVSETFAFELGSKPTASPPSEWDTAHRGFTAGELLTAWLHQVDAEYVEGNRARYLFPLIRRALKLSEFAPEALKNLKTSGRATFTLDPWWLYREVSNVSDLRVRSLAVSVPCVTGAHQAVNATLRLTSHKGKTIREAIVLSSGLNDTGWDQTMLAERYGPFENLPLDTATSWVLEFPNGTSDLDLTTISDVILHVDCSASRVGAPSPPPQEPAHLALFDAPRMFTTEWAAFVAGKGATPLSVDIEPFLARHLMARRLSKTSSSGVFGADGQKIAGFEISDPTDSRLTLTWEGAWSNPDVAIVVVGLQV
jgi:Tc toxin complex TcA C-terminal TcB-binding domain